MILLTETPIDPADAIRAVTSPAAGAVVLFLGTTRELTAGRRTVSLDYQGYPEMAQAKMAELAAEATARWELLGAALIHRLGNVLPGETSVAVAVSAAHRQAAFEAGQWLIDTLKQVVPIWKRENWADGESQWIHPTGAAPAASAARPPSRPSPTPAT